MKKILKNLILLLFLFIPALLSAEENYLFISIDSTLMASDPDQMGQRISEWASSNGGYFTHLSTDMVILRFPWKKTRDFRSYLNETSGEIYSYSSSSTDLRESINSSKSGIEARTEILKKNMELVEKADFKGTLYLEQEILRLMSEIEQLKGSLRKAENDRKMAQAVLHINFRSHSLPQNIPSSFSWINTLNFSDFIEGSFYGKARGWSYQLEKPSGFALVDNRNVYRAISPEGIRFQIRKEKNYPLKELDFWSSTLLHHMVETGYQKKDDGLKFETEDGSPGFAVEWGLSLGNKDYLYLTAIVPHGKTLYIIEVAGEIGAFNVYEDEIYTSLKSFSP
jgi:hypothetical protein